MSVGHTDIMGGKRLPKDHPILECLGTIDELNAFLGDAKIVLGDKSVVEVIDGIQTDLSRIMGVLAGMPVSEEGLGEKNLIDLIKELELELPSSASFAVPGANPASAKLHIARAVCRRAERRLFSLGLDGEIEAVASYMNRLSNLLFLLAQREAKKWN